MLEKLSVERVMAGDENYISELELMLEMSPDTDFEKEARKALVNFYTLGEGKKRADSGSEHLKRDYESALNHARKLMQKSPEDTDFYIKFCWILINSGRHEEAIKELIRIQKRHLSGELELNVLAALARVYYKVGDYEKATSLYEKIIETRPSIYQIENYKKTAFFYGGCLARIARMKVNSGDLTSAIEIIEQNEDLLCLSAVRRTLERAKSLLKEGFISCKSGVKKVDVNKISIVCVKHGKKYHSEYVNNLYSMLKKNLSGDWQFCCITDDARGIDSRIDIINISNIKVGGWWTKIALFDIRIPLQHETVLYFDLDTVITGSLDFIKDIDCGFYIFEHPDAPVFNSSVMLFERNLAKHIFSSITPNDLKRLPGDQEWIEECVPNANIFEPGRIALYRGLHPGISLDEIMGNETMKIVTFPANPKPHTLISNWVKDIWKY